MQRFTRRGFVGTAAWAAGAAFFGGSKLFGQVSALPAPLVQARTAAASAKISTQTLRRNVRVLMGSGGNIVVLPGKDGKLLIDSGFSTSRPQIEEALTALGEEPLTMLINTHWHFDHVPSWQSIRASRSPPSAFTRGNACVSRERPFSAWASA